MLPLPLPVVPYHLHPATALVPRHARTLSLHDHILQAYLPYFTAHHFRNERDVDLVLDDWLRSHPDLLESTHHYPLRERDFRNAFYLVIDCSYDVDECGEHPIEVSRRILEVLEDEWTDDIRFGSGRGGSKAQRLFRALAEVSSAAASGPIGTILRTFFLGWLHEIAEEDGLSLAGWCSGVVRSSMDGRDKEDCLRAVVALRPDILAKMNRRGSDWLSLQSINAPVRNWPRRRRSAGRLWWDQDNDRRIRQMIEDQDELDRAENRRRKKMDLLMNSSPFYSLPRRAARPRTSRSANSRLRRPSPLAPNKGRVAYYVPPPPPPLPQLLPSKGVPYMYESDDDARYRAGGPAAFMGDFNLLSQAADIDDRYATRGPAAFMDIDDSLLGGPRVRELHE